MFLGNIIHLPYFLIQVIRYSRKRDKHTDKQRHELLRSIVAHANKAGRITIEYSGTENIPEKDGFIMFPNHQGLYDVLAFLHTCEHPFSVVIKKELKNIPMLNLIFDIMRAKALDREDVKQGLKVISEVKNEVLEGKNYIIFAEGTRSKQGNNTLEFKGGSFKAAIKAKCPIVPVAIIDSFKPFDTHSIEKVTVQVHYLKPLYYEDYKDMKSTEIASYVRNVIQQEIDKRVL